jgi:F-type H+-transporting ATPase subunit epsilon
MIQTNKKMQLDIVSVEKAIFSGQIDGLAVTGKMGELGILPGHTPLLTLLKPGEIRVSNDGDTQVFYVSGGTLEVQPDVVTILADTVVRAKDLDEASALESKARVERAIQDHNSELEYETALAELAELNAQLRAIRKVRSIK